MDVGVEVGSGVGVSVAVGTGVFVVVGMTVGSIIGVVVGVDVMVGAHATRNNNKSEASTHSRFIFGSLPRMKAR